MHAMKRLLAMVALSTTGCASGINYAITSVPEEGSIRFTRITADVDGATGPTVYDSDRFGKVYYVARTFDVSPDGKSIAFIGRKADKLNVYLKSTEGGAATTQRTFRDVVYDVAFSPDGDRLAFSDTRNERINIYEVSSRSGAAIKQITNFDQTSRYPAYSPSSNSLVYVQSENSTVNSGGAAPITRYYIWSYDLDKGAHTQYAEGYAPAFSPNGEFLALTRNSLDHGNSEVWVVNLKTGEETLVASNPKQGYAQPSFSPDGQKLVMTGVTLKEKSRPTNFDIYTVGIDGGNLTQLTFHPGDDLSGKFSPDGRSIYFVSERGSDKRKYNVWRMDLR